jgi:hypothetical protein
MIYRHKTPAMGNDNSLPAPPECINAAVWNGISLEGCECWKRSCKAEALPRQLPAVLQIELLQRRQPRQPSLQCTDTRLAAR